MHPRAVVPIGGPGNADTVSTDFEHARQGTEGDLNDRAVIARLWETLQFLDAERGRRATDPRTTSAQEIDGPELSSP